MIGFSENIDGMTEEIAQSLVEQGYLSYDDLAVIEPEDLMEIGNLTAEEVDHIVEQATRLAEEAERAAEESRRRERADQPAGPADSEGPPQDRTEGTAPAGSDEGASGESEPGGTAVGDAEPVGETEDRAPAEPVGETENRAPAESEPTEMGTE